MGAVVHADFGRDPEALLTKGQYAALKQRSRRWLELRVREGLPSELKGGRRIFRLSDADPWLERYEREKRKPKPRRTTSPEADRLATLERRVAELEAALAPGEDAGGAGAGQEAGPPAA